MSDLALHNSTWNTQLAVMPIATKLEARPPYMLIQPATFGAHESDCFDTVVLVKHSVDSARILPQVSDTAYASSARMKSRSSRCDVGEHAVPMHAEPLHHPPDSARNLPRSRATRYGSPFIGSFFARPGEKRTYKEEKYRAAAFQAKIAFMQVLLVYLRQLREDIPAILKVKVKLMRAHHIAIYTRDLARLEAFYTQVLGFPVVRRWDAAGIVFVDAGGLWIELTRQDAPDDGTQPRALDQGVGINHFALQVDRCRSLVSGACGSRRARAGRAGRLRERARGVSGRPGWECAGADRGSRALTTKDERRRTK